MPKRKLQVSRSKKSVVRDKLKAYKKHPKGSFKRPKFSAELPKFLDAESSITAARFGARRLPEMKKMWKSLLVESSSEETRGVDDYSAYYKSGGCKISNRHLRRRTGSHNRRRRHRFPANQSSEVAEENDASGDIKCDKSAESLKSRRARRKPQLLRVKNSQWKNINRTTITDESEKNIVCNDTKDEPPCWLETHLWHSKRFFMSHSLSIYDKWCLPLGHTNRGSRAALRLAKSKSTIQDATWSIAGRSIIVEIEDEDDDMNGCSADLLHFVERMCGGSRKHSALFLLNERVIQGAEVGYGLVYELGSQFPLGVVGPAYFMFGKDNDVSFVNIIVDGSIINKVEDIVRELATAEDEDEENRSYVMTRETMGLIRVRGAEATEVISKSLKISKSHMPENDLDWNQLSENKGLHASLSHGTILKIVLDSEQTCRRRRDEDKMIDNDQDNDQENHVSMSPRLKGSDIILISQNPNGVEGQNSSLNSVVNGWDIICPPSLASTIFTALNYIGGACAIGYVEESCFRTEAEPPLPVWPRDYPDTEVGKAYWSGDNDEWNVLRYCVEEGLGGGRIKTGLKRLLAKCNDTCKDVNVAKITTVSEKTNIRKVDWGGILQSSSDNTQKVNDQSSTIVLVRGSFRMPFVNALDGFGRICVEAPAELMEHKRRRPRRRVQGKNKSIFMPPMKKELFERQTEFCETLLQSLSFSALLRCHLVVEGKGTIYPGMTINCGIDGSIQVLGQVVAGCFSQNRGYFHGLGIISSRGLLSVLTQERQSRGRFMSVDRFGQRVTAIKVVVFDAENRSKSSIEASLALVDC